LLFLRASIRSIVGQVFTNDPFRLAWLLRLI
jgi:hypothetical protein